MAEHWQIFVAVLGLVAAWSLIIIASLRVLMTKCISDLEKKVASLGEISKDYQSLERALLQMKADLPLSYVRKEDFVRFDVVINTKLDRLRDLIESLRERRQGTRQEDN
jgi:hypothetical protein